MWGFMVKYIKSSLLLLAILAGLTITWYAVSPVWCVIIASGVGLLWLMIAVVGDTWRQWARHAEMAFREYLTIRMRQPRFANARSVRNELERARLRHAFRLATEPEQGRPHAHRARGHPRQPHVFPGRIDVRGGGVGSQARRCPVTGPR
jgi:hypothetical protein